MSKFCCRCGTTCEHYRMCRKTRQAVRPCGRSHPAFGDSTTYSAERVRIWRFTTTVETTDAYEARDVLAQIRRDLNRGDGLYMHTGGTTVQLKLAKIKQEPR